jgi:predicted nucleic acid-binding protein
VRFTFDTNILVYALLISEDGQDGRTLGGVTIVTPFLPVSSPLLQQALGPD